MKPKGEIKMGRHEAYVWDSVSMEWIRRPLYEKRASSEIRAEVPYAEFMERPKNTGTVKRHIKERNLKRLRKAGNDEEKYEIICDIYRLPCLLEMSKKE